MSTDDISSPASLLPTSSYSAGTIPKSIAIKLCKASQLIQNPAKSGAILKYNNFKYSDRDDVSKVIRPVLNEVGLFTMISILDLASEAKVSADKYDKMGLPYTTYRVVVTVGIRLVDGETGEFIQQSYTAEALDASDKAIPKAVTQALRHWAINSFWLTDGGESYLYAEENEPRPNYNSEPRRNQAPAQRSPQPMSKPNQRDAIIIFGEICNLLEANGIYKKEIHALERYLTAYNHVSTIDEIDTKFLQTCYDKLKLYNPDQLVKSIKSIKEQVGNE